MKTLSGEIILETDSLIEGSSTQASFRLESTIVPQRLDYEEGDCASSYEVVMIGLTLPLWTFITFYLILLLIYSLRRRQYESVYDKCHWRNAHFRYDFHMIIGRHSANYSRHESYAILDLLDNELVSTLTIQIPGQTMFNDHQMFVYRHSRDDMRCVNFTVYRRHPIKDIKCIRIAHTCTNAESRLYMYGLEIYDQSVNETRFFPIQSVVKYRGTQWAISTTFEPKSDVSFKKMGVECYDPFANTSWPTYLDLLTILLFIWCSTYALGTMISVKSISDSIPLHALTIFTIVATLAGITSYVYLRRVKIHIVSNHFEHCSWFYVQNLIFVLYIFVSIYLWTFALDERKSCRKDSIDWLISTVCCSLLLSFIFLLAWCVANARRLRFDSSAQAETDAQLAKTNSRENLAFANDPKPGFCASMCARQTNMASHSSGRDGPPKNWNTLGPQAEAQKGKASPTPPKRAKSQDKGKQQERKSGSAKEPEETLDTAFGVGSKYIKAKNRNSISQYV